MLGERKDREGFQSERDELIRGIPKRIGQQKGWIHKRNWPSLKPGKNYFRDGMLLTFCGGVRLDVQMDSSSQEEVLPL